MWLCILEPPVRELCQGTARFRSILCHEREDKDCCPEIMGGICKEGVC